MSPPPEDAGIPVPELLSVLIEMGGSDLHLMAGSPPFVPCTANSCGSSSTLAEEGRRSRHGSRAHSQADRGVPGNRDARGDRAGDGGRPHLSTAQAMGAEAIGTFVLMITIMALAVDARAPAGWAGWIIGMAVGGVIMALGPATGASLNPARTFGPYVGDSIFGGRTSGRTSRSTSSARSWVPWSRRSSTRIWPACGEPGIAPPAPGLPTRSRGGGEDVADPRGRAAVIRRDRVRIHWR